MKPTRLVHMAALVAGGLLLCGCPNPNTYTVPRTLVPGDLQFTAAPEVFGYHYVQPGGSAWGAMPTFPTVGFRYGLSDLIDVGGRLSAMASPAGDVKFQVARGIVDVAVDPGVQLIYVAATTPGKSGTVKAGVGYLYAPILVGYNMTSALTLVASPGIGFAFSTPYVVTDSPAANAAQAAGFSVRLGLGVDIRASEHFALHPELTVMRVLDGPQSLLAVLGLGFNIGAMPDYSDLEPKQP
jgi:hypothetical protein